MNAEEKLGELTRKHGPAYDWRQDYYYNYDFGPFCKLSNDELLEVIELREQLNKAIGSTEFLGFEVDSIVGVPAGPLLNGRWILHYAELGWDLPIYKTTRTSFFKCHPFPQVLLIRVEKQLSEQDFDATFVAGFDGDTSPEALSITNSFGMPSKDPSVWASDLKRVKEKLSKGQLAMMSVVGTPRENGAIEELALDYAAGAKLAFEAGAHVVELNFSCPNIKGKEGQLFMNPNAAKEICRIVRETVGDKKFVVKMGYCAIAQLLEESIEAITQYADGVSAINTIPARIMNEKGEQALPGDGRLKSGVCGNAIREGALNTVKKIAEIREKLGREFALIGVGGITKAEHAIQFLEAGADAVQSATGAMWDPLLALKIKSLLAKRK